MIESKVQKHVDGSATIYYRNRQDGAVYYYAQEIGDGWQGDVYDITEDEYNAIR